MRLRFVLVMAATVMLGGAVAWAAQEPIEDVELNAANDAVFDPDNGAPGNNGCLTADIEDVDAYTPVEDGFFSDGSESDDAFDDGLLLLIEDKSFVDGNDMGDVDGRQISVGPDTLSGLKVTRTDRALPTSPTLRSLIELKNPNAADRKVTVEIQNDYGADGTEVARATSSTPKGQFTASDRWLIIADSEGSPEDAIPTTAFYGKGAAEKVSRVTDKVPNANSCVSVNYQVKVPGNSKRILMLFTQLAESDGLGDARANAKAFNDRDLSGALLKGLGDGEQAKIVNWDLD